MVLIGDTPLKERLPNIDRKMSPAREDVREMPKVLADPGAAP